MEHSHDSVRRGACGASVTVAFPGGARVSVEVTDEVASALRDMQRETWRIERRFTPGATPDLSSYATKEYVAQQIAALDDLSGVEF